MAKRRLSTLTRDGDVRKTSTLISTTLEHDQVRSPNLALQHSDTRRVAASGSQVLEARAAVYNWPKEFVINIDKVSESRFILSIKVSYRSFTQSGAALEALFEKASIPAGDYVFIHRLLVAFSLGTKSNTEGCMAQADRASTGESRRQEKCWRHRRWLLAGRACGRLWFGDVFSNL